MPEAIFYRNGEEQFREYVPDPPPREYRTHHCEPFDWSKMTIEPTQTVTEYLELYQLNQQFKCPNCKCLVYNSINWHTLPPWVFEEEAKKKEREAYDAKFKAATERMFSKQ